VSKNAVSPRGTTRRTITTRQIAAVTLKGNLDDLQKQWQKEGLTASRQLQLQQIYKNAQLGGSEQEGCR
jgi:hypothetical protein